MPIKPGDTVIVVGNSHSGDLSRPFHCLRMFKPVDVKSVANGTAYVTGAFDMHHNINQYVSVDHLQPLLK